MNNPNSLQRKRIIMAALAGQADHAGAGVEVYPSSHRSLEDQSFVAARIDGRESILVTSPKSFPDRFPAPVEEVEGRYLQIVPLDRESVRVLWELFPFTAPRVLRSVPATFGTGDRLALGNIGHVRAFAGSPARPVLAQQSVRELTQTQRSFADVVVFAGYAVFRQGYTDGFAADGDHLKRHEDIVASLEAGATMITLDVSEFLVPEAAHWSDAEVERAFGKLPTKIRESFWENFAGRSFQLKRNGNGGGTSILVSPESARRCAVIYGRGIEQVVEMIALLRRHSSLQPHIEVSVDETSVPTEPAHHYMIVRELRRRDCSPDSLAPRFVGEFQKGIDYRGDIASFRSQLAEHQTIVDTLGGYKLSIHSGSDKFAVYPSIAEVTRGRLHVKTSGTSWLEAVRSLAEHDPVLYRSMHGAAFEALEEMQRLYHITPDLAEIPALESLEDAALPQLMENPNARQVLHVAYGKLLNDPAIGPAIRRSLLAHADEYAGRVEGHIRRHLRLLGLEGQNPAD